MSAPAHAPALTWAHLHRAALVIAVLCLALAGTLGLLTARIVSDAHATPTSAVFTGRLHPTGNDCEMGRPGVRGVLVPC